MSNPVGFRKAYPNRIVNSIYYDDLDYNAYNDNLLGIGHRIKYRVRWYGQSIEKAKGPILEKKIKINQLGKKEYLSLPDFNMKDKLPDINAQVPQIPKALYPHIIVRYSRAYLESADSIIRATVDRNLQYINLINGCVSDQRYDDNSYILEIKYDQNHSHLAQQCLQSIPYRMTKNSKYVSAMRMYLG